MGGERPRTRRHFTCWADQDSTGHVDHSATVFLEPDGLRRNLLEAALLEPNGPGQFSAATRKRRPLSAIRSRSNPDNPPGDGEAGKFIIGNKAASVKSPSPFFENN